MRNTLVPALPPIQYKGTLKRWMKKLREKKLLVGNTSLLSIWITEKQYLQVCDELGV
jgi:hypothetical protein